jgi:hypothetical protein
MMTPAAALPKEQLEIRREDEHRNISTEVSKGSVGPDLLWSTRIQAHRKTWLYQGSPTGP